MATFASHGNLTAPPVIRTIEGNVKWEGPLSFNFVDTEAEARAYSGQTLAQAGLPADWIEQIRTVLTVYDEVVALDISVTDSPDADYLVGTEQVESFLGSANGPFPTGPGQYLGLSINVEIGNNVVEAERGGGSERLQTMAHEIGHTLGLNHPHADDDGSSVAPGAGRSGFDMPQPYQGHQTALSYALPPDTSFFFQGREASFGGDFGQSVAPMAIDIAALHRMYGANMESRIGDTTYRLTDPGTADLDLSSDDGIVSVGRAYYGIWDAGVGDRDTVRYDGTRDAIVNLLAATPSGGEPAAEAVAAVARLVEVGALDGLGGQVRDEITNAVVHPGGFFSSVIADDGTREPGGYSIAQGVVIETAQGGSGDDLLIGNGADNVLIGNGGDDVMAGGAGDDVARFSGSVDGYALGRDGEAVTVGGPSGADTLHDVEALIFRDAFVLIDTETTLSAAEVGTLGYLYEAGLDRDGALDVAGLEYWLGAREEGLSEESMAGHFLDSAEFAARNGAPETLSDRALVEALYRNVLDRDGEEEGVGFWTGRAADDAVSRSDLLLAFAVSEENAAEVRMLGVFDDAIL